MAAYAALTEECRKSNARPLLNCQYPGTPSLQITGQGNRSITGRRDIFIHPFRIALLLLTNSMSKSRSRASWGNTLPGTPGFT